MTRLFTGLTKITYDEYEKNDHFITTQEEVEAALATGSQWCYLWKYLLSHALLHRSVHLECLFR